MIYADLFGKQSVSEDVFTSNCLGLLSLLPDRKLLDFISMARTCRRQQLPLPLNEQSKVTIDFWPYLPGPWGCIPDAILTVDGHQLPTFKVIVEVKTGSPQTGDQLARYWRAGNVLYDTNFALIYVTHHRSIPIEELQSSEINAGPIYWLSWHDLFLWTHRQISAESSRQDTTEGRILRMLQSYLEAKGYRTFLGWAPSIATVTALPYRRTYSLTVRPPAQSVTGYARSYMAVGIGLTPCLPYVSKSKELV